MDSIFLSTVYGPTDVEQRKQVWQALLELIGIKRKVGSWEEILSIAACIGKRGGKFLNLNKDIFDNLISKQALRDQNHDNENLHGIIKDNDENKYWRGWIYSFKETPG